MFDLFGAIGSAVSSFTRSVSSAFSSFSRSVTSGISHVQRSVQRTISSIPRTVSSGISHIQRTVGSGITNARRTVYSGFRNIQRTISRTIPRTIPTPQIPQIKMPPIKPKLPPITPKTVTKVSNIVVRKVSEAAHSLPTIKVKTPQLPQIKPSSIKLPEIKLPQVHISNNVIDIQTPKIKLPEIRIQTPKVKLPEIRLPEVRVDNKPIVKPQDVNTITDSARKAIINIVEKRDAIYERGDLPQVAAAMAADWFLPLDLAKVLTKGAEKPEDYFWAGIDVIGLIPFAGWAVKGAVKGGLKSAKLLKLAKFAKTGKEVEEVAKLGKGVESMSWIKGLFRLGKLEGKEIKELKSLRTPRIKLPEIPKFSRFRIFKDIKELKGAREFRGFRRLRLPRKIPHFEMPKLRNPFARMKPVRTFKVADEIPEVAKLAGKAGKEGSAIAKLAKKAAIPLAVGGIPLAYMALTSVPEETPEDQDRGGREGGGGEDTSYLQDLINWFNGLFGWGAGGGYYPPIGDGDYPYGYDGNIYPDYFGGEEYPIGYENLPPEYGYPEGYAPPAYVPESFADYVAPAEDFAQDILGAIEGVPIVGDVAAEARRSGFALPLLIVGAVGAYGAYKYGYPKLKKMLKKGGKRK